MKTIAFLSLVLGLTTLPTQAATLHNTLLELTSDYGWKLTYNGSLDWKVNTRRIEIMESLPSLGTKIRYLTAKHVEQNEIDVWSCNDYKMIAVLSIDEFAPQVYGCERLFLNIDRIAASN